MGFLIAYLIVSISCIVITSRTLIAYCDCAWWIKAFVYLSITSAWFMPMALWSTQAKNLIPVDLYVIFAKVGYFMYGLAFILVILIMARDMIWSVGYFASLKRIISPNNIQALNYANIATVLIALGLSAFAVYSAEKLPNILNYEYTDSRIKKPLKVAVVSDIHLTKMQSPQKIARLVKHINTQKADILLMVGDIGDDKVKDVQKQVKELKKLKAEKGIFFVTGNHESYFNTAEWEAEFAGLGWQVLHNSGTNVAETGLYIAGIPDAHTSVTNVRQAFRSAKDDDYRVLMSHIPAVVNKIGENKVDIQVSGHTHGGQIFPFNIFAKYGNEGFVAGEYLVNNTKLLLSRGVGYWGPQMRLFAPSDIILITLKPQK